MEAATEKKRGRPSVFAREGTQSFEATLKALYPDDMPRTTVNRYYSTDGMNVFNNTTIDHGELLYSKAPNGRFICKYGIFEQVGRMRIQDGYSVEDCVYILQLSANALHDGATVKQIISYIRHGRKTGDW